MMPSVQAGQAVLVPALSPVLDTVEVGCKLVCYLLQRQSLAQPHNGLSPHPGTWMAVENAHVAQCANFRRGQFQTFDAVSLRKLLQALTANIARLLSCRYYPMTATAKVIRRLPLTALVHSCCNLD
jgi:hypothetical protein